MNTSGLSLRKFRFREKGLAGEKEVRAGILGRGGIVLWVVFTRDIGYRTVTLLLNYFEKLLETL